MCAVRGWTCSNPTHICKAGGQGVGEMRRCVGGVICVCNIRYKDLSVYVGYQVYVD